MVAVMQANTKGLAEILLAATKADRTDVVKWLANTHWEAAAGFGVLQSALTRFYISHAFSRAGVVPAQATVAFHPKYMRRILKHLRCPRIDVGLLGEVGRN